MGYVVEMRKFTKFSHKYRREGAMWENWVKDRE
jgi:hypothetical protein